MQDRSKDHEKELALLKLKTLEMRIQYLQRRASETENRIRTSEELFSSDPVAQCNYLMQFDLPGVDGCPSHSLIESDLDQVKFELGESWATEKSEAEKEFEASSVVCLSAARHQAEMAVTGAALMRALHAASKLLHLELKAASDLQKKLLSQLGTPLQATITVDLDQAVIFIDKTAYPVGEPHAIFVSILLSKRGMPVSSTILNRCTELEGVRCDRLRKELKDKYKVPLKIESKRGTGYWIPME